MTDDCVFCGIIAGRIPSRPIYSTDTVQAFLDVNPLSRGHTLVIPADHYETVSDLPTSVGEELFATVFQLAPPIETAVEAHGTTIGFNNGQAAGQEIPHVHGHVIPRFDDDTGGTLHTMMGGPEGLPEEEMDAVADAIRATL